ncbi:hypothetical protein BT69DRAFT_1311849 [Atractiella rhizophila]|nr:hypothetical protein BT69DRAFT_1311849 [Atractiella rhizophila]
MQQPPHQMGYPAPGLRARMDPDQIPSPVAVAEQDQDLFQHEPYMTCGRGTVPLSNTEFTAVDQGNCNPRFMRSTTYCIPATVELAAQAKMPFGLIIQPFAQTRPQEGEVPVVDFGETGPPRCSHCRGYINPWCVFIEGGQKFVCNLCGGATEVHGEYFCHLDMSGRRVDLASRPELYRGSLDFRVHKEYHSPPTALNESPRTPQPLNYIFAIDVSWTSVTSRVVDKVAEGIKEMLPFIPQGGKVAIITFDRTAHFYNMAGEQATMLVVADLEDMFVPLSDGFLCDPVENRSTIEALLDSIPGYFAQNKTVEAALVGAPLQATLSALKSSGGILNIFQTTLPTMGPGSLKHRENNTIYNTDKERTLFAPQDPLYRQLAEECVLSGIGVNVFLFPSQYIDVATVGVLSGLTGGEIFFYPRFDPVRDGTKLLAEIKRIAVRETGYNATMRIRCSNGLRVSDHFGNFFMRNSTDVEFGIIDADKAIAAIVKHEGKLDEKQEAHFQCAVLYTTATGERRVRTHNLAIPVSTVLGDVFRYADMDTTLACVAKQVMALALSKTLRQVRDHLTEVCVKVLLAYRKHCASSTSPGQLILPESFKLFPLFTLALNKSKALKGGNVASDVRTYHMRLIKSMSVSAIMSFVYPRMISLHALGDEVGNPTPQGGVVLPPMLRTSYTRMETQGAYLIENGIFAIMWLGSALSPKIVEDLYGTENIQELDPRMTSLPELPTKLSGQVRAIVSQFEKQRGGRHLPILISRQGVDGTEVEFSNMLIEDQNNDTMSYMDFLKSLHMEIQKELSEGKAS